MTREEGEAKITDACATLLALIAEVRDSDPFTAVLVRFERRVVFCSLDLPLTVRAEKALRSVADAYGEELAAADAATNVWTS